MQFRMPKPMRGWRAFAGEIAIIVIGVLIALGAQSMIERWHWRGETQIAEQAFRDELGSTAGFAYERLIIQPCLRRRITEISQNLGERGPAWKASPMAVSNKLYLNVLPVVYRAPTRPFATDGWHSAIANGTLSHLPPAKVRAVSALYDQVADFETLQEEEAKAAAKLAPLGFDRNLDDQSRTTMLSLLGEVDRINSLVALNASQFIEAIRELKLRFPPQEIEAARRELLATQRATRGSCVRDHPLQLG
jgi:hypothetical protein